MKKINNYKKILLAIIAFSAILSILIYGVDLSKIKADISTASGSAWYDWSQLTSVDTDYSYSNLYYTRNTKIYYNAPATAEVTTSDLPFADGTVTPIIKLSELSDTAQIIITNCGRDKDGHSLSAVLTVTPAVLWGNSSNNAPNSVTVSFGRVDINNGTQNSPVLKVRNDNDDRLSTTSILTGDYGMPLVFSLKAVRATAKVDVTYYTTLNLTNPTNNNATTALNKATVNTNTSVIADIDKVNAFFYDIDITQKSARTPEETMYQQIFAGREGVASAIGHNSIYYQTDSTKQFTSSDYPTSYKIDLDADRAGVYVKENSLEGQAMYNVEGIWYNTAAEFFTSELSGKYSFYYSGDNEVHIKMMLTAPAPYDYPKPVKTVSKSTARVGESFYYEISQYIPKNTLVDKLDFSSVYSNLPKGNYIGNLVFEDSFPNYLEVDTNNITVTDENNNDLSNYINVNVTKQTYNYKLTTELKSAAANYFKSEEPYGNTIKIKVPVKYNTSITSNKVLSNYGQRKTFIGSTAGLTETEINQKTKTGLTNTVNTTIVPLTLTYDCHTNGGTPSTDEIQYKIPGESVDVSTSVVACSKSGYQFIGWGRKASDTTPLSTFTMPDTNTTLYAIYNRMAKLVYNCNGNGPNNAREEEYIYGTTGVQLNNNNQYGCSRSNATFKGWNTDSRAAGSQNTVNMVNDVVTVYAIYQDKLKLTYWCNSTTKANDSTSYHVPLTSVTLSTSSKGCSKTNASFVGWNKNQSATSGLSSVTMQDSDVDVYAIYKDYPYLIYDCNGYGTATDDRSQYSPLATVFLDESRHSCNKANATFKGWNTDRTATTTQTWISMPETDIRVYAIFEDNPTIPKLTYDCKTNGGTPTSDKVIDKTAGSSVDVSTSAYSCSKTGYQFMGWGRNSSDTTPLSTFTMPSTDTTLYAIYKKKVKLIYNCNGNGSNNTNEENYLYGDIAQLNNNSQYGCSRSNATFKGWNTNPSAAGSQNTVNMVNDVVTVYAIYQDKLKLTYWCSSTTKANDSTSYHVPPTNVTLSTSSKGCSKTNASFVGWNKNPSATSGLSSVTLQDSDVDVYAIYKDYPQLTYWCDATTKANDPTSYQVPNSIVVLSESNKGCSKQNATFRGWNTSRTAQNIQTSIEIQTDDKDVYAIYKDWPTLTYDCNGGGTATDATSQHAPNSSVTLSESNKSCSKTNKTFIGWNTNPSATSGQDSITMPETNTIVYAIYEDWPKLTYWCDVNTKATDPTSYQQPNSVVVLSTSNKGCSKENASFHGWNTSPTAQNKQLSISIQNDDKNVYAVFRDWPELTYNCEKNGGTALTNNKIKVEPNTNIDLSRVCSKNNYDFVGWNRNDVATNKESPITMPETNLTIYGIYKYRPKLTYDCDGGTPSPNFGDNPLTMHQGDTVDLTRTCTKSGYTQKGWSNSPGGTKLENLTMGSVDKKIYAIYDPNPYNLTYDCVTNGGAAAFSPTTLTKNYGESVDLSKVCTKDGYTHIGWKLPGDDDILDTYSMPAKDVTLIGIYEEIPEPEPSSLTYNCNGGGTATDATSYHAAGSNVTLSTSNKNCSKTNKSFVGWNTDPTATGKIASVIIPSEGIVVYAIYKDYPILTYDCNGGGTATDATSQHEPGSNVTLETTDKGCSKTNATFIGWNTDKTKTNKQESITMPETNTKVYAIYKDWPSLTYYCNATTMATLDPTSYHAPGSNVTLDESNKGCSKTNASFIGWDTEPNSTSRTESITMPETNTKVYAVYKDWPTLTYNCEKNGGAELTDKSIKVEPFRSVDLSRVCSKTNFDFVGWNKDKDATSKEDSIDILDEDLTIYGIYKFRPTLTYNCNGGTQSSNFGENPILLHQGDRADLTRSCTKQGYMQKGWSNSPAGDKLTSLVMSDYDVEIYAIYDPNPYDLTYDCVTNGGEALFEDTTVTKYLGDSVDLSKSCSKEGFRHIGWKLPEDEDLLETYTMPSNNVTLIGVYEEIPEPEPEQDLYNLEYDCNGGTLKNPPSIVSHNEGDNVDLSKVCTRDGYKFIGWHTDKTSKEKLETYKMPGKNETIYGIYEKIPTLKYDCNGGKALFNPLEVTVEYNKDVDLSKKCDKPGYEFKGWNPDKEKTKPVNSLKMPKNDLTIYGIYEKITCNLLVSSNKYNIDENDRIIDVETGISDEEILSGIDTNGEKSISSDILTIKCDNISKSYTIRRYYVAKTGNSVIDFKLIIAFIILFILSLIAFKKFIIIRRNNLNS